MERKVYTKEKLAEVLAKHRQWRFGITGGQRAYLRGAYLRGADLHGAKCNGEEISVAPIFLILYPWQVTITDTNIGIGCQIHPAKEWADFSDGAISRMSDSALKYWGQWKPRALPETLVSIEGYGTIQDTVETPLGYPALCRIAGFRLLQTASAA